MAPLKRFIRQRSTGAFLTKAAGWTPDSRLAQEFPSSEAAIRVTLVFNLIDVELYLQFGESPSPSDVSLPLPQVDGGTSSADKKTAP
jgi:hypothetical protein